LESHNLVKERLLSTASLLGATGCGVAIIWKRVLFSKRKETRQEDGDHAKGEASGEGAEVVQCRRPLAPRGRQYMPWRTVTLRASTVTTDP
jgi:hypothetical protein